ncbi:MAG: hypothetical protein V4696_08025 [Pseudomonadota bacterium]
METIFARLDAASINYEVYLDSAPVQHRPLASRKLTFPKGAVIGERFNSLVRAMNAGSASNGAWRRVLIASSGHTPAAMCAVVRDEPKLIATSSDRLSAAELRRVTNAHVDASVARLVAGEDAPNFDPSRDFDLLSPNGERLAPKKVFGLALETALGIVARPEHFSAGLGTPCFQILEAAGYPIIRKDEPMPGGGLSPVDPDLAAAEGSVKLVAHLRRERNPALAAAKRRAMIAQLGYLQCERCDLIPGQMLGPLGDAVIEVHHAGTALANMEVGQLTRLADLMCLCANCHRIVHREAREVATTLLAD